MTMYKLHHDGVLRDGNTFIPMADGNADYEAYKVWLADGNVPDPADPIPAPVYSCSPWQIRKALNALGLRDAVEAVITDSNDRMLKDGWAVAQEYRSDDIFVLAVGASLGKDAAQTAEMIQYASTL